MYLSLQIIFLSSLPTVQYFTSDRYQPEPETMFVVVTVILAVLGSLEAGPVVAEAPSVKLSVYYESLCGDSIRFITTQLFPAWQHFADDQTLQLDLVPFGKADVRLDRSFTSSSFNILLNSLLPMDQAGTSSVSTDQRSVGGTRCRPVYWTRYNIV